METDAERLVVGFSYSIIATVVSSVFAYVAGLIVMRLLGPGQYGLYQLVFMVPSLLAPVLNLGIEATMVRFVPRQLVSEPSRAMHTARYLFMVRAGISIVACAGMLALSPLISRALGEPVTLGVMVASLFFLANMLYAFMQALFQAFFLMRYRAIMIVLYSVAYVAIVLPTIYGGLGYVAPIAAFALAAALAVSVGLGLARRAGLSIIGLSSREGINLAEQIRFAAPVYMSNLLGTLFAWISVILIRAFGLDVVTVGYFRGVYNIVSFGLLLAISLNVVVMPYVSELESKGNRAMLAFFCTKVTKLLIILGIPAAVGLMLVSRAVLASLLPDYAEATSMMQILSLLLLFMPVYSVSNTMLTGVGRPDLANYASMIICAGTFVAGGILGALARINGIAAAHVVSMFAGLVYSLLMMTRLTGASIEAASSVKAAAATSVMGVVVYAVLRLIPSPLLGLATALLAGVGSYAALVYFLGALSEEDFRILRTAVEMARQRAG